MFASTYAPGQRVKIAGGEIDARVQSVQFSKSGVRYYVTWWDSGTRKEDWFDEDEIQITGKDFKA